jgi:transposase InsO family protein
MTTPLNSDESLSVADHNTRGSSQLSGRNGQMKPLDHYTRADVFDHIEMFYNPRRRHSHLGGVSPEAYEASITAPEVST